MAYAPPSSIQPTHRDDQDRIHEQALRVRILRGQHKQDVEDSIAENVAPEIAAELVWSVDLSANPLKTIFTQLNNAYTSPPALSVLTDDGAVEPLTPAQAEPILTPILWPLQQQRALFQMAVRECAIRLDWPSQYALEQGDRAEVRYRVVTPDCIHEAHPLPRHPDRLGKVCELRQRTRSVEIEGEVITQKVWTYDVWDITQEPPIFRIEELDEDGERVDVTAEFMGTPPGEPVEYPYRDTSGRPIMPYVLAHGRVQSSLWDWHEGSEITQGTLKIAGGYTWWWDGFYNAANPQRVAIDLVFGGGRTMDLGVGANVETIPISPKSILQGSSKGATPGRIDSYPASMDPRSALQALRDYEERLAIFAGLSPADLQISSSGQSGIAIQVSRHGKRQAQARYMPAFKVADQLILSTASRMANAAIPGLNLPEDERRWVVEYARMDESPSERKIKVETIQTERALGILSRVGALRRLHPEIETDEQALNRLTEIDRQDRQATEGALLDTDTISSEAGTIFAIVQEAIQGGRVLSIEEMNDILESAQDIVETSTDGEANA